MKYRKDGEHYSVLSSDEKREYGVNADLTLCSCPSRKYPCKHLIYLKEREGGKMSNAKAITKEISEKKTVSLQDLIESKASELGKVMTNNMNPERLCRIAVTQIRKNPKLGECTPVSLLGAIFMSAELGLEPIGGLSHYIPFRNKGVLEVQFIVGYQGLVNMFYRHESALSIDPHTVHENDVFDYAYGTDSFIKHIPAMEKRGKTIGYYVVAKMKNGGVIFKYMSFGEVLEYGETHSKSYDKKEKKFCYSSPWNTNFDSMGKKTVIRQISKTLPLSITTRKVLDADETSRHYRDGIKSAFELPNKTEWDGKETKQVGNVSEAELKEKKEELKKEKSKDIDGQELITMQEKLIAKMDKTTEPKLKAALQKQIDEIELKLTEMM